MVSYSVIDKKEKIKMAYHHSKQLYKKQRRSKRLLKFSLSIILIILIGVSAVLIDNFFNRSQSVQIASTGIQARVQSSSINVFRTPYFQFQADESWREVTDINNPNKFVYRSYNANLVQHEFVVEIDDITPIALDNENTTRNIPIKIEENRLAAPFGISDNCSAFVPEGSKEQARVSFNEAEFPCNPDGNSFVVVASLIGGNEFFEHVSSDGTSHRYKLTYQDSTFTPTGREFRGIVDSFQLL